MTKKILSALLAIIMVVSCMAFTASAADTTYYVEAEATGGDGSKEEPFGTIEEAILALEGKNGTVVVTGSYDITKFKVDEGWEGMVTVKGADEDAVIVVTKGAGVLYRGDITFENIKFEIGEFAHFNPIGSKLIMDGGEGSEFAYMLHLSTYSNAVVDEAYAELKSGKINIVHGAGGYSTSYANGVMGDSTIIVDGATVKELRISADSFMENHTGISIGGNFNVIYNGGEIGGIAFKEATKPEIMGALNIIFNNGMEAPEKFAYPESAASGVFIIKSAEGGMVMPTAEVGVFEVKANKGKIAQINGEQVLNGKVTLEAGETEVTWVDGQQEEPIEIKLTIDSKEIVKNGEKSELDVPAQIVEGRTLVPLRAIFEALGASVEWNGETSTVTSEKDGTAVKLTIGENKIYVNGEAKELDVPAQIIESRTMVPARAVAEAYGCAVEWDADTRTVIIKK